MTTENILEECIPSFSIVLLLSVNSKQMSQSCAAVYAHRPCRLADVVSLFPNGFDLISTQLPHVKPPKTKYVRRPNRLQSARHELPDPVKVKASKTSRWKRLVFSDKTETRPVSHRHSKIETKATRGTITWQSATDQQYRMYRNATEQYPHSNWQTRRKVYRAHSRKHRSCGWRCHIQQ